MKVEGNSTDDLVSSKPLSMQPDRGRVLVVCGIDSMAWVLLKPFLVSLLADGWSVDVACHVAGHRESLESLGVRLHHVDIQRRFNPITHIRPIIQLWKLIKRERFDTVNLHGVLAAYLGRIACRLVGQGRVLYYVHGFYFHENMNALRRLAFITVERILGRQTVGFVFVSGEDFTTAIESRIVPLGTIADVAYNGVDENVFNPATSDERRRIRHELSIPEGATVIGIVGRIVREKGHPEFLQMARQLNREDPSMVFLIVGDSLPSDRDQYGAVFRALVAEYGLTQSFRFPGLVPDVDRYLKAMDIFVLPSHREGFPRSVLEAMATALPVVATRIRGCREAVRDGETGLLIPVRDASALESAVRTLTGDRARAVRMGAAGRKLVLGRFTTRHVQDTFLQVFKRVASTT